MTREQFRLTEEFIRNMNMIRDASVNLPQLRQEYIDNGWHHAGANPLTNEDLAEFGFTIDDLQAGLNFVNSLSLLLDNGTPVQRAWRRFVNIISRR